MRRLLALCLMVSAAALAQDWSGQYFYRTFEIGAVGRNTSNVDSKSGGWTLDRTNTVDFGGGVIVPRDPTGAPGTWNARHGVDGHVILAAKTESTGDFGLLLAVRSAASNPPVSGIYRAATIQLTPAKAPVVETVFGDLDTATAQITLDEPGAGRLSHPQFGNVAINISPDGQTIIGTPEGRDGLFVAVRQDSAAPASLLWLAGFSVERNAPVASIGSLLPAGSESVRVAQRFNTVRGSRDYRGAGALVLDATGKGALEGTPVAATAEGGLVGASPHGLLVAIPAPQYTGDPPFLHPHGAVSAASLAPVTDPAAPSAFLSLYGAGLLPAPAETPSVLVNGQAADVIFASTGQVNVRLPASLSAPASAIVVSNSDGESEPVQVRTETSSPAVFSADYTGAGPAMVTHADFTPVSAAAPARRGEIVLVWAAGLGINQPAPRLLFGGIAGQVLFAGEHPDFPGLYQMNVRIPQTAPTGNSIPLTLMNPEGESDTVTLAIGQ